MLQLSKSAGDRMLEGLRDEIERGAARFDVFGGPMPLAVEDSLSSKNTLLASAEVLPTDPPADGTWKVESAKALGLATEIATFARLVGESGAILQADTGLEGSAATIQMNLVQIVSGGQVWLEMELRLVDAAAQ